jgi:salicylate hydroxylase
MVQQSGTDNRHSLHLPDGAEQVARDEQFKASMTGAANPDIWNDRRTQSFLWGWDAEEEARRCWMGTFPVYFHFR